MQTSNQIRNFRIFCVTCVIVILWVIIKSPVV